MRRTTTTSRLENFLIILSFASVILLFQLSIVSIPSIWETLERNTDATSFECFKFIKDNYIIVLSFCAISFLSTYLYFKNEEKKKTSKS